MMQVDIQSLPEHVLTRATELLQGVPDNIREDNPIAKIAYDWVS